MYRMPYYTVTDQDVLVSFMKQYPFAIITANGKDGFPVVSHIPLLIKEREGKIVLLGHIMRKTDHHIALAETQKVLAVFSGPHTYVSASWYSNPLQGATWNYMTVHAHGRVQFVEEEGLHSILKELTTLFENDETSVASYDNLSPEYVDKMSKAIIGFEMVIEKVEGVFKLSQNRDKASYEHIITKLSTLDEEARKIATEMEIRKAALFPIEK